MSVPLSRFWAELTTILPEIASARYVAIDFEMTGIDPPNAPPLQRPTMEQLYERAKTATAMFNVLQFGLTCISYEKSKNNSGGTFHLKSYNFNVSPMFDTRSNGGAVLARVLDRTLTLSYKTLMFLSKNRIRIEDAYDGGIPYLGRAEEAHAVAEMFGSNQRAETELIDIGKAQEETQQFCVDVTNTIREWESDPTSVSLERVMEGVFEGVANQVKREKTILTRPETVSQYQQSTRRPHDPLSAPPRVPDSRH